MEAKMDTTIRAILEGYFGEGSAEDDIDDLHREIYKAGIREVVEWIQAESLFTQKALDGQVWITKEQWQAKLKEWGIKEGK